MKLNARALAFTAALTLTLAFLPAAAQEKEKDTEQKISRAQVPPPVLAAFAKSYPQAKVVGYSREVENGKTLYEIESKEGAMTRDATYLADGTLHLVEESMPASELPQPVTEALHKNYPKAQIKLAEKLTEGGKISYELHLKQDGKELEVKFDPDGKIVK